MSASIHSTGFSIPSQLKPFSAHSGQQGKAKWAEESSSTDNPDRFYIFSKFFFFFKMTSAVTIPERRRAKPKQAKSKAQDEQVMGVSERSDQSLLVVRGLRLSDYVDKQQQYSVQA